MPETLFQCALRDSVQEVLEKMFFVEPVEEPPGEAASPDGEMAVQLAFEGVPSGVLPLCVTSAAARQIADLDEAMRRLGQGAEQPSLRAARAILDFVRPQ